MPARFYVDRSHTRANKHETFIAFLFSLFLKIFVVIDLISDKLLIHEFNYAVFFMSILIMPALLYLIKMIPQRYTVYSGDTISKLDLYEYQLSRLKLTYNKLSKEMNMAALNKTSYE